MQRTTDDIKTNRRMMAIALSVLVTLASVGVPSYAESDELPSDGIIVVYEDGADSDAAEVLEDVCEVEEVESISENLADNGAAELITVDGNEDEAIEELNDAPGVAFAQKNYQYELMETRANDERVSSQYYLNAWDATFEKSVGANIYDAWDFITDPSPVTVAVLDTGCDTDHEDLAENLLVDLAYNAVTEETGAEAVIDTQSHGTHVTGIIGAVANNNTGIAGASGNLARIVPIKIFSEKTTSTANIVKGMEYLNTLMADGKVQNLHVINLSVGGYSDKDNDIALRTIIEELRENDVLTICAGGNGDSNRQAYKDKTVYPGDFDACLSVTALDQNGNNATFSDYNMAKDISAPGSNILSTLSSDANSTMYGKKSGTSMATPIVSATAAMLWAYDDNLTADEVVEAIEETAHPVNTAQNDRTGETGSKGAIDAAAALNYVDEHSGTPRTHVEDVQLSISQTEFEYDGSAHMPEIRLTANGRTLEEEQDYIVHYQNNVIPGIGTAIISGKGEYKGTISTKFTIKQANISKATITLSKTSLTYNGKSQAPTITVNAFGEVLEKDTDYTVSAGKTAVGIHEITITGTGRFSGTKTLTYRITPKGTTISKLTKGKKRFTVKWKSQKTQTSGYQIRYSTKSNMSGAKIVKVSGNKKTSRTIKKLKAKKTYYVQIRTYKNVNGKMVVSSWSKTRKIRTK